MLGLLRRFSVGQVMSLAYMLSAGRTSGDLRLPVEALRRVRRGHREDLDGEKPPALTDGAEHLAHPALPRSRQGVARTAEGLPQRREAEPPVRAPGARQW